MSDEFGQQLHVIITKLLHEGTYANPENFEHLVAYWFSRKLIEARMDEHQRSEVCDNPDNCPRWLELKHQLEALK